VRTTRGLYATSSFLFHIDTYCSCNYILTMTEPFPPLNGTLGKESSKGNERLRLRTRKSSALGEDIRGDVNVPSFATARKGTPPLNSPVSFDVSVCMPCAQRSIPAHLRNTHSPCHRSQTSPAAAPSVAPCAARFPNSGASAYDTHGSAR
jgi:hypothetical protein